MVGDAIRRSRTAMDDIVGDRTDKRGSKDPSTQEWKCDVTEDHAEDEPEVVDPAPELTDEERTDDVNDDVASWNVSDWRGKVLIDCNGEKIGKLQDVYVDTETDEPIFATVREGIVSRHLAFVPLGGVQVGPDTLQVTTTKENVHTGTTLALHGEELSQADESRLYHHFELNYTPPATESGRRLGRR